MKRITLLIISLMLCLLLTACSDSEAISGKYKSFICDYANDGIITSVERDWWIKGYETNLNASAEKRVDFEGSDYCAVYKWSLRPLSRHNIIDIYRSKDIKFDLYFDSVSENFSGIFFIGAITEKYDDADIENSHDKALEKAKSLASKYINLDEYVLTETQYSHYRGGEENAKIGSLGEGRVIVYEFTFTKEQNNFETSDAVFINITSKGNLQSFHVVDNGLFSQREVPKIDKDKLSQSIDEKLKKIYSGYKYSYEIVKQTLTLSPEGKVIVVSQIDLYVDDLYSGIDLVTEIE